jgi:hypothetical protein
MKINSQAELLLIVLVRGPVLPLVLPLVLLLVLLLVLPVEHKQPSKR